MNAAELERFDDKIECKPMSGCWLWAACVDSGGYGQLSISGRALRAHRLSYEHYVGPIPDGLHIDHLCRVRCCVNPAHLEPVTQAENIRRGDAGKYNRIKTHCKRGHLLDEGNTRLSGRWRTCIKCHRANGARLYAEKMGRLGRPVGLPKAERTHCPRGHEYAGDNVCTRKRGWRACRECKRISGRRDYWAKKVAAPCG